MQTKMVCGFGLVFAFFLVIFFFFFNDTATTEIYTLSLHDALPISGARPVPCPGWHAAPAPPRHRHGGPGVCHVDRKSGGEGKRVDLGGRRIIKKKKKIYSIQHCSQFSNSVYTERNGCVAALYVMS